MKLQQFRLIVEEFGKSAAFYRDVMGFSALWFEEGEEYALFDTGDVKLEVVSRRAMADAVGTGEVSSAGGALLNVAVDDVDEAWTLLRERGAEGVTPPRDYAAWGVRIAYFRDPDGNLIEFYKKLEASSEGA